MIVWAFFWRMFLQANGGWITYPNCSTEWTKMWAQAEHQHSSCFASACECISICFKFLQPWLTCLNGAYPWSMNQYESNPSSLLLFSSGLIEMSTYWCFLFKGLRKWVIMAEHLPVKHKYCTVLRRNMEEPQ